MYHRELVLENSLDVRYTLKQNEKGNLLILFDILDNNVYTLWNENKNIHTSVSFRESGIFVELGIES